MTTTTMSTAKRSSNKTKTKKERNEEEDEKEEKKSTAVIDERREKNNRNAIDVGKKADIMRAGKIFDPNRVPPKRLTIDRWIGGTAETIFQGNKSAND